ncbi:MAG TPA: hypothetical protein VMF69_14420 [Gemmataceae bacterium]|nr:hypothetical protein [Gemmataceae bacterium]
MIRLSRLLWPFPFGVRLGWLSTSASNPDPGRARGWVFLLRGNGIVFSRGFRVLCDELRRCGVWAEDLRCIGDRWACRHLRAEQQAGRLRQPIIFVGHSCGGRYSLYGAHELQKAGITVDLIVCLDVALPPPVPGNVKCALNLYRAGPRLYPARPLIAAPGSSAEITNIELNAADSPINANGLHHLNITDSPTVQALVLARILETLSEW